MTAGPRLALTLALALGACGAPVTAERGWRPADPISVRYREAQSRARALGPASPAPLAPTWAYRSLLAPALGARCRLLPSDSEYVDRRARACGTASAIVWGTSRFLLEVGIDHALAPPVVLGGRVQFVDLPPDRCAP